MRLIKCLSLSGLLACLIIITYLNLYISDHNEESVAEYGQYMFTEYYSRGVFTVRDICVERNPYHHHTDPYTNVLVIYNSAHDSHKIDYLQDYHSSNSQYGGWPVLYRRGPIPSAEGYHSIMDHPAYFMVTTCEGNLHHIIDDSLLGLYGLMGVTGRLNKPRLNQVFTTSCKNTKESTCHSYTRFLSLVLHAGVRPDTYGCINDIDIPLIPEYAASRDEYATSRDEAVGLQSAGVCYRHAGFGFLNADKQHLYRYLTSAYSSEINGTCEKTVILLVDRSNRRVLNIEQLYQATVDLGLTNTHVEIVDFATLSVDQQIQKVLCSHIIVGVQGAGLQWIYFLPPHSAILEIGWKRWKSKYVARGRDVGIRGTFLDATENMTVNWREYEDFNKERGGNLTQQQKQQILQNNELKFSANPYKFGDTRIGVDLYLKHLKPLIKSLQKDGVKF